MRRMMILVAAVALLCGCMGLKDYYPYPTSPAAPSTTETTGAMSSTTSAATTSSLPQCLCCEFWGDEWDGCIYDAAVESLNFSLCRRIEGKLIGSACFAAERGDAEICDLIDDAGIRNRCYYGIAVSGKDAGVCEKISLQILKDSCLLRVSRLREDMGICDRISTPTLKDICRGGSCVIREDSADMVGYVDRSDFVEISVAAEGCVGETIDASFDSQYLALIDQSKNRFDQSEDSASLRFRCREPVNDTIIRLKADDSELEKKASCGTAKPPPGCELIPLDDESSFDSIVGWPIYFAFRALNCKDEEVGYAIKPRYLQFSTWAFNGELRDNKSNRTKTDDERIVMKFVCNGSFGSIQLKATAAEKILYRYVVCRQKPKCRLRVSEEDSKLEGRIGEEVELTVFAIDCRYENLSYSGEGGWLTWVDAARTDVSENTEKIKVNFLCRRASDYPLYVSVKAGEEEALGYAYCNP